MIYDLPFSARAEKRSHLRTRLVELLATAAFAGSVAAAVASMPASAWGMDNPEQAREAVQSKTFPPSQLDPMPGLELTGDKTMRIDTLMTPRFDPSGIKLVPEGRNPPLATG